MKIINRELPWTSKTEWFWPSEDEKLVQVFDHVSDINYFMEFVKNTRVCVQAGGACGVWPLRYALLFDSVITFEPMQENYEALMKNIEGADNINVHNKALSNRELKGSMVFDRSEHNNYGAVYFKEGQGNVNTITIDSMNLKWCDLLQLDIEGGELQALDGAQDTINRCSPIIVLEEKPLPQLQSDYREPRRYIESLGYREVGSIHKDVVFAC